MVDQEEVEDQNILINGNLKLKSSQGQRNINALYPQASRPNKTTNNFFKNIRSEMQEYEQLQFIDEDQTNQSFVFKKIIDELTTKNGSLIRNLQQQKQILEQLVSSNLKQQSTLMQNYNIDKKQNFQINEESGNELNQQAILQQKQQKFEDYSQQIKQLHSYSNTLNFMHNRIMKEVQEKRRRLNDVQELEKLASQKAVGLDDNIKDIQNATKLMHFKFTQELKCIEEKDSINNQILNKKKQVQKEKEDHLKHQLNEYMEQKDQISQAEHILNQQQKEISELEEKNSKLNRKQNIDYQMLLDILETTQQIKEIYQSSSISADDKLRKMVQMLNKQQNNYQIQNQEDLLQVFKESLQTIQEENDENESLIQKFYKKTTLILKQYPTFQEFFQELFDIFQELKQQLEATKTRIVSLESDKVSYQKKLIQLDNELKQISSNSLQTNISQNDSELLEIDKEQEILASNTKQLVNQTDLLKKQSQIFMKSLSGLYIQIKMIKKFMKIIQNEFCLKAGLQFWPQYETQLSSQLQIAEQNYNQYQDQFQERRKGLAIKQDLFLSYEQLMEVFFPDQQDLKQNILFILLNNEIIPLFLDQDQLISILNNAINLPQNQKENNILHFILDQLYNLVLDSQSSCDQLISNAFDSLINYFQNLIQENINKKDSIKNKFSLEVQSVDLKNILYEADQYNIRSGRHIGINRAKQIENYQGEQQDEEQNQKTIEQRFPEKNNNKQKLKKECQNVDDINEEQARLEKTREELKVRITKENEKLQSFKEINLLENRQTSPEKSIQDNKNSSNGFNNLINNVKNQNQTNAQENLNQQKIRENVMMIQNKSNQIENQVKEYKAKQQIENAKLDYNQESQQKKIDNLRYNIYNQKDKNQLIHIEDMLKKVKIYSIKQYQNEVNVKIQKQFIEKQLQQQSPKQVQFDPIGSGELCEGRISACEQTRQKKIQIIDDSKLFFPKLNRSCSPQLRKKINIIEIQQDYDSSQDSKNNKLNQKPLAQYQGSPKSSLKSNQPNQFTNKFCQQTQQ